MAGEDVTKSLKENMLTANIECSGYFSLPHMLR